MQLFLQLAASIHIVLETGRRTRLRGIDVHGKRASSKNDKLQRTFDTVTFIDTLLDLFTSHTLISDSMTSLSTKLAEREAAGNPIQVGLIGAGKFGSML